MMTREEFEIHFQNALHGFPPSHKLVERLWPHIEAALLNKGHDSWVKGYDRGVVQGEKEGRNAALDEAVRICKDFNPTHKQLLQRGWMEMLIEKLKGTKR